MSGAHELLNVSQALPSGAHELLARVSAWLWPAFANHLWQATLFAALVLGVTLLLRRAPARVRFALWLLAAAKFAVPSALLAPAASRLGASLFAGTGETAGAPLVLKLTEPVGADASAFVAAASSGPSGHAELLCALTLLWLAGCAALACVWLVRRREFVRSVRAGEEVWSGREYEAMRRARARLGLKEDALLVLSDGATEPGVWRTHRPVVVLPRSVSAELDEEELESVLLHELAHVERRDNLFGNLQTALACALWFNPVVWLVGRRMLAERERACDERVLEAGGGASAYASGILKVVRFCSGWRVAGVSGAASGSDLRRRIEMIMREERVGGSRLWHRAVTCGLAAAALALTAGAGLLGRA
ncbi:MAG TPA: M56 family metallopeptidase, partial [Pyrinomonadaceae bacterium]|nr:M56 family metallopeptidase [Pyrinomonadaceae bacterium]